MSLLLCHPGTFAAVTGPALAGGRGGGDHDGGGVGGRRKTWRMEMGGSESVGGRSMPVVNCGAAGVVGECVGGVYGAPYGERAGGPLTAVHDERYPPLHVVFSLRPNGTCFTFKNRIQIL